MMKNSQAQVCTRLHVRLKSLVPLRAESFRLGGALVNTNLIYVDNDVRVNCALEKSSYEAYVVSPLEVSRA